MLQQLSFQNEISCCHLNVSAKLAPFWRYHKGSLPPSFYSFLSSFGHALQSSYCCFFLFLPRLGSPPRKFPLPRYLFPPPVDSLPPSFPGSCPLFLPLPLPLPLPPPPPPSPLPLPPYGVLYHWCSALSEGG